MSIHDEIMLYLRASESLIVLVTVEEQRVLSVLDEIRGRRKGDRESDLVTWDFADGFDSKAGRPLPDAGDPVAALDKIKEMALKSPARLDLYVLKDFHEFWSRDPKVRRKLRTLAQSLVYTSAALIVTTPTRSIPDELRDDARIVEFPLPTADELQSVLDALLGRHGTVPSSLSDRGLAKLSQAALGLTVAQARRAFAKAMVHGKALDDRAIDVVVREKQAIIRESEALDFFPAEQTPDDVGGLESLKAWLVLRERAFTSDAAGYGLPAPKGLALIGIPGTGKSLTAKMISGMWHLPLLRLDVGALFGSLVGESEERVRQALRLAEAVSPCVLWIDELDKAFGAGDRDGGTSARVFGTILTWMQEKTQPVFVVATANDVAALPPETLRRGRFDEVFFLDLPTEQERRDIIGVHLRKRRRDPQDFDVRAHAHASDGFVGAELEQAVIDAMYQAFAEDRDIRDSDLAAAIDRTVPLSRSQRENIDVLRAWMRDGRAQPASSAASATPTETEPQAPWLDLDPPDRGWEAGE